MRLPITLVVLIVTSVAIAAVQTVSFPAADGSLLYGDLYGSGDRGVIILAHGGYSTRESWSIRRDVHEPIPSCVAHGPDNCLSA